MVFRRRSTSHELADGSLVLTSGKRYRKLASSLFLLVLVLILVGLAFRYYEREFLPNQQLEQLERENLQLRTAVADLRLSLERAMLDLEIAAVTRSELERQLIVLNESHKQVKEKLEFMESAGRGTVPR